MSDEIQLKKELYFTNSWFLQGIYKRIDKINMFVCYQGADISITFADTSFIVRGKPFDFLRKGGGIVSRLSVILAFGCSIFFQTLQ